MNGARVRCPPAPRTCRAGRVAPATGETGISVTVFLPTEWSGQSVLLHRPTVRPPRAHNVGVAQDQSVATAASGVSTPPSGSKQPSNESFFLCHMAVEPLHVAEGRVRGRDVDAQMRGAMARELEPVAAATAAMRSHSLIAPQRATSSGIQSRASAAHMHW